VADDQRTRPKPTMVPGAERTPDRAPPTDAYHAFQGLPPNLSTGLGRSVRRIVGATVTCALLVGVSVQLVDRPVATWVHAYLSGPRFDLFTASYNGRSLVIGPFSLLASPAEALGPLAALVVAILAVAAASGWRPKMHGRIALALSLSVIVAMAINGMLKPVFGRTWPESWLGDNPSWIRDGVFGFFLFHGGSGWGSFPSGHTTTITAPAVILWMVWRRLRVVWATTVAVVVTGLVGADYHFVSDTVAGLYLGVATGLAIAALVLSPGDRVDWSSLRRTARAGLWLGDRREGDDQGGQHQQGGSRNQGKLLRS
jgi:membrane-associated phospholipid phosphatase